MKHIHMCDWHGCGAFGPYVILATSLANGDEDLEMFGCLEHTDRIAEAALKEVADPHGPGGYVEVVYPAEEYAF